MEGGWKEDGRRMEGGGTEEGRRREGMQKEIYYSFFSSTVLTRGNHFCPVAPWSSLPPRTPNIG